jgi:hypothetical protein
LPNYSHRHPENQQNIFSDSVWYQHPSQLHKCHDTFAPVYLRSYSILQRKIRFEVTFTSSLYNAHRVSDLNSGGCGLQSESRDGLSRLIFSVAYLSLSGKRQSSYLKQDHNCFPPHTFQFKTH